MTSWGKYSENQPYDTGLSKHVGYSYVMTKHGRGISE